MKLVTLILGVLFVASQAAGQSSPPSGLAVIEQTKTANLGSILNWNVVAGATYNVYRTPNYDCGGTLHYVEIAHGLTTTTYTDNPTPALPLGGECYSVTSVVAGVESAKATPVSDFLGMKHYFTAKYDDKTSVEGSEFILYENGTPVIQGQLGANGTIGGMIRLHDGAVYSAKLTLPTGTVITFSAPYFADFGYLPAIESNQNTAIFHHGDDTFRHYLEQVSVEAVD